MKQIVHIEDAEIVNRQVTDALDDWFGLANVSLKNLDFEEAAAKFIDEGESKDVILIIIDLMVTYNTDDTVQIPKEVLKQGAFDAGFRLIRKLQSSPAWKGIPLVILSSVEKSKAEERLAELDLTDVTVFQKAPSLRPFLLEVQKLTGLKKIDR